MVKVEMVQFFSKKGSTYRISSHKFNCGNKHGLLVIKSSAAEISPLFSRDDRRGAGPTPRRLLCVAMGPPGGCWWRPFQVV